MSLSSYSDQARQARSRMPRLSCAAAYAQMDRLMGKDGDFDLPERQWAGLIEWAGASGTVTNTPIPLPPLAEQAVIVARVEALMTTCRALETEIEHARTHAAHLLQAVLKEAFTPAGSTG